MNNTITLGKSGRLVIPKAIRESLGLRSGARLNVRASGGILEMKPLPDDLRIEEQADGFPVIRSGRISNSGGVSNAIKADRETRDDHLVRRRKQN